jgi:hypothetical protein
MLMPSLKFLSSDDFYLPFHLSTASRHSEESKDPSAAAGTEGIHRKRKRRLVIELEG